MSQMIRILRLSPTMGHETIELPVGEAKKLVLQDAKRCFIIDWNTKKILHDLQLEDGQVIAIIPKVQGG